MASLPSSLTLLAILTVSSFQFFNEVALVRGDVGTAVSYGPPYLPTECNGYSQDQFPPGNMFAAVNDGLWDNGAACGRKYRLRCLSGIHRPCKQETIDVEVIDRCSNGDCSANILLSKDAFATISHISNARVNIEYIQI